MRALVAAGLVLVLVPPAAAARDKKDARIDPKLLVGVWKQVEPATGPQIGTEFTADGKVHMWDDLGDGKRANPVGGTYTLTGNTLTIELKDGKIVVKGDATITKLTKDECWSVNKLDNRTLKMNRVEPKK